MQATGFRGLSVFILEDEVLLRKQLAAYFESLGMEVTTAGSLDMARRAAEGISFDFALLDVNLPDGKGTDLLRDRTFGGGAGVIVMTAQGGVEGAVEAMKLGALDYLVKPFDPAELPLVIARARRARQTARLDEFRRDDTAQPDFLFGAALAGVEQQLRRILAADQRVQTGLAPVLITGETGSGKTSIARWLHQNGPRARQPLVEVNCSALPENLAESELFGHERGAFTDARATRIGLFEAANDGTLFLDELPSLSSALQAKVLTVIEDGRIRRLGGSKTIEVDVRVIAATNRDLKQAVAAGTFREDLFHRLDLFRIALPPLRERGEDILGMAEMLLGRLCRRHRLRPRTFTRAGRERLLAYPWPGNVRELAHEIERALVFSDAEELAFANLASPAASVVASGVPPPSDAWFNEAFVFPERGFVLDAAIDRLTQHALNQAGGNVSAAARLLGVSRDVVRYRLEGRKASGGDKP